MENESPEDLETYSESFERSSADLEILCAAYPDEINLERNDLYNGCEEEKEENQPDWFPLIFTLNLTLDDNKFGASITMEFPKGYPTSKALEIVSYRSSSTVKKDIIEQVVSSIRETANEALDTYGGEECGLACCAAAIERWSSLIESEQQREETTVKIPHDTNQIINSDDDINWITSENILVDRKSVFQAHVCVVRSDDMVSRAVNKLIEGNTKIQRATHNMYAYRFSETLSNGSTILKHDNDDDGEDAAGSRLAQLLEMRKEDGVLVLVSRWYGGIHLGPKRFAHITNVARDLLVECHEKGLL